MSRSVVAGSVPFLSQLYPGELLANPQFNFKNQGFNLNLIPPRILWLQVNSEFQTYKHVDVLSPGEQTRAQSPLEATLSIHPTVVLTNALPYSMDVVIWQVRTIFGSAPVRLKNERPP